MNKLCRIIFVSLQFRLGFSMRIIKFYTIGLFTMLLSLFAVSCSQGDCEDYEMVIPKDAYMVVAVNLNNVVKKSDLSHSPLFKMVLNSLSSVLGSGMKKKMDAVVDNPSLTGIDYESPAYAFEMKGNYFGLTMKVEDENLLKEFINSLVEQNLCTKIKEHDGLCWSSLLNDIELVYSDNTLMLVTQLEGGNKQMTEKLMCLLMQQDYDNSFVSTDKYTKIKGLSYEDVQLYANMAALPNEILESYKQLIPVGAGYSNMEIVACVGFNKGSIDIKAICFSNNAKVQKQIENYSLAFKKMDGYYSDKVPENCNLWMCAGINGDKLLEILKHIPQLKEILLAANLGVDFDNMLRAVNGDMLLYTSENKQSADEICMRAQLDNTDFMNDVSYWQQSAKDYGVSLKSVGKNQYLIKGDDMNFYWAVDGKELYFGKEMYKPLKKQSDNKFMDEIKENNLFVYIDASAYSPLLKSIVITSDKSGELDIKINATDRSKNILKGILNIKSWK